MRLLVLGGTRFVGRLVLEAALDRGWEVTALHRGLTGVLPAGVTALVVDRTDVGAAREALGDTWDAVLDTWADAPSVARDAAQLLTGRVERAAYVSSRSVYADSSTMNRDETAPVVDGDPDAGAVLYPADKRGGELAWLAGFPDVLLLRAGLVLGPYEDVARLPWWLDRISRGGRVVAPGRPERPLQYVDGRDLAAFALDGLEQGLTGAYDVVSAPGHTTMRELLETCIEVTGSDAELVWVGEAELAAAGAEPWTQLPCWLPESGEDAGFMAGDTRKALAAGLVCRALEQTVAGTWEWMQREGVPKGRPGREPGLPVEVERALLSGG
ncbi:MAG: reductase [Actinomycetota bacterium]|nr:reductase [Actinomycetota bacterium]